MRAPSRRLLERVHRLLGDAQPLGQLDLGDITALALGGDALAQGDAERVRGGRRQMLSGSGEGVRIRMPCLPDHGNQGTSALALTG
jgi:hypothetical protein